MMANRNDRDGRYIERIASGAFSIAEREHADTQIDKLIDGAAFWQAKWRRDGSKLTNVLLAADLEIAALRQQLRENGIEPIDGERTRGHESTPFITDRDH